MSSSASVQAEIDRAHIERDKFIARVRAQEELATRDPKASRRHVARLIGLAYAYITGMLLLALLLLAFLVIALIEGEGNSGVVRLALIVGLFVFAILRSLWVKLEPPKGFALKRSDAPTLYKEVDSIAERLDAPKPHEINLNYDVNASAAQTPRLGMFGFYKNTLSLGLPLLMSLTPDEARAVIAHEFGHFSGSHGKFGAMVYRVQKTWEQMWEQFRSTRSGFGAWLFVGFVNWFQPRLAAASFAIRRANEYEADEAAAKIAGADNAARVLMRLAVLDRHIGDGFWEPLTRLTRSQPEPPANYFGKLGSVTATAPSQPMIETALRVAFSEETDYDDTHPCLADRLRAIKQLPAPNHDLSLELAKPIGHSAADEFFGDRLPFMISGVEGLFREQAKSRWLQEFRSAQEDAAKLKQLRERAAGNPLTEGERIEMAYYVYQVEGVDAAEPMLRELRQTYPQNQVVAYWLGRALAEKEDMAAEPLLKEAMALNPKWTRTILGVLGQLYYACGEVDKLKDLRSQAVNRMVEREVAEELAQSLSLNDTFEGHGMDEERLAALKERLKSVPKLEVAYMFNKVLAIGERSLTVVAFHERKGVERNAEPRYLVMELMKVNEFPEGTAIFCPDDKKRWKERLDKVEGAKIYGS